MTSNRYNAKWWNDETDSSWDKVKEALKRDWAQSYPNRQNDWSGDAQRIRYGWEFDKP